MSIFRKAHSEDIEEEILQRRPDLIKQAREWAKDLTWGETEEDPNNDFIDRIPPERLLRLINRHFDGGLEAFYSAFSE